jgi:hypothetical protein
MEVQFFKNNRSKLIAEMFKKGLKPKDYKVDLFLVEAFFKAHPEQRGVCEPK